MDLNHYRFKNVWRLKHRPQEVYRVLEDIGGYPAWWPEVRRVDRIDDKTVRIVARSLLPYSLAFQATDSRQDDRAGALEVCIMGIWKGSRDGHWKPRARAHEPLSRRTSSPVRNHCDGLPWWLGPSFGGITP
jgi:hypothetical protein